MKNGGRINNFKPLKSLCGASSCCPQRQDMTLKLSPRYHGTNAMASMITIHQADFKQPRSTAMLGISNQSLVGRGWQLQIQRNTLGICLRQCTLNSHYTLASPDLRSFYRQIPKNHQKLPPCLGAKFTACQFLNGTLAFFIATLGFRTRPHSVRKNSAVPSLQVNQKEGLQVYQQKPLIPLQETWLETILNHYITKVLDVPTSNQI